jgi:hypothetical protein
MTAARVVSVDDVDDPIVRYLIKKRQLTSVRQQDRPSQEVYVKLGRCLPNDALKSATFVELQSTQRLVNMVRRGNGHAYILQDVGLFELLTDFLLHQTLWHQYWGNQDAILAVGKSLGQSLTDIVVGTRPESASLAMISRDILAKIAAPLHGDELRRRSFEEKVRWPLSNGDWASVRLAEKWIQDDAAPQEAGIRFETRLSERKEHVCLFVLGHEVSHLLHHDVEWSEFLLERSYIKGWAEKLAGHEYSPLDRGANDWLWAELRQGGTNLSGEARNGLAEAMHDISSLSWLAPELLSNAATDSELEANAVRLFSSVSMTNTAMVFRRFVEQALLAGELLSAGDLRSACAEAALRNFMSYCQTAESVSACSGKDATQFAMSRHHFLPDRQLEIFRSDWKIATGGL